MSKPVTTLVIKDQVNIKFADLDAFTRRKLVDEVKYFIPSARHQPAYKLGRWDGTMSFANVSGTSFLNLLDRLLPIVEAAGYDIDVDDHRPVVEFAFPECDELLLADTEWPENHPMAGEPIMLRDYQVRAIQTFFENPASVQQISTGAGKCHAGSQLITVNIPGDIINDMTV